eukprot:PhM_4_TR18508/c1_g2_i1/m.56632
MHAEHQAFPHAEHTHDDVVATRFEHPSFEHGSVATTEGALVLVPTQGAFNEICRSTSMNKRSRTLLTRSERGRVLVSQSRVKSLSYSDLGCRPRAQSLEPEACCIERPSTIFAAALSAQLDCLISPAHASQVIVPVSEAPLGEDLEFALGENLDGRFRRNQGAAKGLVLFPEELHHEEIKDPLRGAPAVREHVVLKDGEGGIRAKGCELRQPLPTGVAPF